MSAKVEMAKLGIQFLILVVTAYLAPAAKDWLTQKEAEETAEGNGDEV